MLAAALVDKKRDEVWVWLSQMYFDELLDAKRWSGVLGMGRLEVAKDLQEDMQYLGQHFGIQENLRHGSHAQTHLNHMQAVADMLQADASDFVKSFHAHVGEDAPEHGKRLAQRVLEVRKDVERHQLD